VRFAIDTAATGVIDGTVTLAADRVNVSVHVEDPAVRAALEGAREELVGLLAGTFAIDDISFTARRPPPPASAGRLHDRRT
jgi:hypothetical protein